MKNAKDSMDDVVLIGFAQVLIIIAVETRHFFKGHSLIQVSFHAYFMLLGNYFTWHKGIISRKLERNSFFL